MIRKLDELGRIVIPIEIRNQYNLKEGDKIEIEEKGDKIILRKHKDTYCPKCLTRCEHIDNFCSKCGIDFKKYKNSFKSTMVTK
jgi:AbrB family looped-hinge helix DNA binding protein|nr:MAG TPA: Transition state regulatory protein abrB HOMODIMER BIOINFORMATICS [Caudoviricetes sp.]